MLRLWKSRMEEHRRVQSHRRMGDRGVGCSWDGRGGLAGEKRAWKISGRRDSMKRSGHYSKRVSLDAVKEIVDCKHIYRFHISLSRSSLIAGRGQQVSRSFRHRRE